jgi:putative ABC transport system permease protein
MPVGSLITRNEGKDKYRVVGVIKDFVYNDMYQSAAPLILFCDPVNTYVMSVRLKTNADVPKALAATVNRS